MRKPALSLVELVVVVVILGVLTAVAIPRFSQAAGDNADSKLRANLAVLRTAIELYYRDHGAYPGQRAAGAAADAGTAAAFIRQLTQHTDHDGQASATGGETFCHGPYLKRGVPPCPLSLGYPSAQIRVISGRTMPAFDKTATGVGWIYNCQTGYVAANSPGVDPHGVRYDTY
jgi:general secretion pathway protein G